LIEGAFCRFPRWNAGSSGRRLPSFEIIQLIRALKSRTTLDITSLRPAAALDVRLLRN
jgi:hypothetical protein